MNLVVGGVLKAMVTSCAPTKSSSQSTGHGRSTGRGGVRVSIGCLFVDAEGGLSSEALKEALVGAAREMGLEHALKVTFLDDANHGRWGPAAARGSARMRRGGPGEDEGSALGDPIRIFRVYVEDGREEPVRGCEFGGVSARSLEDIVATGDRPCVYNHAGRTRASVIAPAVLFKELELYAIEAEHDKRPILKAPHAREVPSPQRFSR
ncbi:hypothetical protein ACFL59_08105 [Planctomycetota bacterium]